MSTVKEFQKDTLVEQAKVAAILKANPAIMEALNRRFKHTAFNLSRLDTEQRLIGLGHNEILEYLEAVHE